MTPAPGITARRVQASGLVLVGVLTLVRGRTWSVAPQE